MDTFKLEIVTPQRRAFSETVEAVYVPTPSGTIGVLAHHQLLFTLLSEGEIKIVSGNKEYYLAIGGGYMQVKKDDVTILVSRAVHADEINEQEIRKAQEAAKDALKRRVQGEELRAAQTLLRRSFIELKVLRHRRRRQTLPLPVTD